MVQYQVEAGNGNERMVSKVPVRTILFSVVSLVYTYIVEPRAYLKANLDTLMSVGSGDTPWIRRGGIQTCLP